MPDPVSGLRWGIQKGMSYPFCPQGARPCGGDRSVTLLWSRARTEEIHIKALCGACSVCAVNGSCCCCCCCYHPSWDPRVVMWSVKRREMPSQGQVGKARLLKSRCHWGFTRSRGRKGSDISVWRPSGSKGTELTSQGRGGRQARGEREGRCQSGKVLEASRGPAVEVGERHCSWVLLIKTCCASKTVGSAIIKSIKMSLTTLTAASFKATWLLSLVGEGHSSLAGGWGMNKITSKPLFLFPRWPL